VTILYTDEQNPPRPLEGCRVVDFSTGLAGPYCTRLFAAAGAEVIKVEPPDGDPMRRWSASGAILPEGVDSAMFRFLNEGKHGLVGRSGDPDVDEMVAAADVVVESFVPAQLEIAALRNRFPGLVVVSLTPFGRTGPWRDRLGSDFTIDAEGAAIATLGRRDGLPVRMGVRITEYIAGVYAAVAALAAWRHARETGAGETIDLSIAETANATATGLLPMGYELDGRPAITEPARWVEVPGVEPTADSWVGLTVMSRQQFDDLLVMIDRSDLIGNEDWPKLFYRSEHIDEWNKIVHSWTSAHSTAEVLELASALRIPSAPVSDGRTVVDFPPFVERGSFGPCGDGSFVSPSPPIRIDGQRLTMLNPASNLGEPRAAGAFRADTRSVRRSNAAGRGRPLEGLRVLDATQWYAGPVAGQLLAALGADVIHLESHTRLEGGRTVTRGATDGEWWERGLIFHHANVGKRSLAVDLNREEGRAAVRRVITVCDLVVENYTPRVFENFGLGWEALHLLNPQVSLVRMPAFGLDGPWRDRVGFAETMEQCTGMASLTGFPDEPPYQPAGPGDPLAGAHGAFGALLALEQRARTGEGVLVEVAMAESLLNAAAEPMVEYAAYGQVMQRNGNRSPTAAPQGLYRCRGFERWLAITIVTDAHWAALKAVMGHPAWADDPIFDQVAGRLSEHDVLDRQLSAWAADQQLTEVIEALVTRGVPAGQLTDPRLGRLHPQFAARGLYQELDHPVVGRVASGAIPFLFDSIDHWWETPAPTLGQHNHEVLRDVGGFDEETIRRLEADGVIGQRLAGVPMGE
jgi:crotonobetainyl-CoA:carnitine CoA-transferase CaiB-like acyl-CoA transferase